MKRFSLLMLSLLLTATLLVGCGDTGQESSAASSSESSEAAASESTSEPSEEEEEEQSSQGEQPTELIVYMPYNNGNVDDAPLVEAAINEHIQPLINATVKLNFLGYGTYEEQTGLILRSGQQIDTMFLQEMPTMQFIAQDALLPLNDLLDEYGQGILEQVGTEVFEALLNGGVNYTVPSMKDMAAGRTFIYNVAIAEELNLDMSSVKEFKDLDPIFAQIKEAKPDMYPYAGSGGNPKIFEQWSFDRLSNSLGVLMDYGSEPNVVNLFEQPEYKEWLDLARDWYLKGYIDPDMAISTENRQGRVRAGVSFGGISGYKPGGEVQETIQMGFEMDHVPILDTFAITGNIVNTNWVIPASSISPEKAMQFLNLAYTDEYVANLIHRGIEGVHYEALPDGTVKQIDPENNKYAHNLSWAILNEFITKPWEGYPLDIWEQQREFNRTAEKSCAYGFIYNDANVQNELAACNNVVNEYRTSLESGSVDPDEVLPQFIEELKAAGIDTIIEEKQVQLDEWIKEKE